MEVILKQDVKNLGDKDDVVNVKPGYGRNFLIPKGMAAMATVSAKKVLTETVKQRAFKEEKVKKAAETTLNALTSRGALGVTQLNEQQNQNALAR